MMNSAPVEVEVEYEVPTTTTTAAPRSAYSQWGQYRKIAGKSLVKGLNNLAATLYGLPLQQKPTGSTGNVKAATQVNHLLTAFRQVKQIVSDAQSGGLSSVPVQPTVAGRDLGGTTLGAGFQLAPEIANPPVDTTTTLTPVEVTHGNFENSTGLLNVTDPASTTAPITVSTAFNPKGVDAPFPIVELPQITYDAAPAPGQEVQNLELLGSEIMNSTIPEEQHRAELISTIHMLTNEINAFSQFDSSTNGMSPLGSQLSLSHPPPPPPLPPIRAGHGTVMYLPMTPTSLTGVGGYNGGGSETVRHEYGSANQPLHIRSYHNSLNVNSFNYRMPLVETFDTHNMINGHSYFEAPPTRIPPPPDPHDAALLEQHLDSVSNFTIPEQAPGQLSSKADPTRAPAVQLTSLLSKLASKLALSAPPQRSVMGPGVLMDGRMAQPGPTVQSFSSPSQPASHFDGLLDLSPQQQQQMGIRPWQQFGGPPPLPAPQPPPPPPPHYLQQGPQPPLAPLPIPPPQNFPPPPMAYPSAHQPHSWAPPPQGEAVWNHQQQQPGSERPILEPAQPQNPSLIAAYHPPKPFQWEHQQTTDLPITNYIASNQGGQPAEQANSFPQQQPPPAQPNSYYQQQPTAGTYSQNPQPAPAAENLDPFSSQVDVNGLKPTIFNPQYQPPAQPSAQQSQASLAGANEFAGLLDQNYNGQNPPAPANKVDFSAKGPNPIQLNQFLAQPASPKEANAMSNSLDALLGTLLSNGASLSQQPQSKPKPTTRVPPAPSGTGLVSDRLNDFILGPKSEFRSTAFSEIPVSGGYDSLNPLAAFMGETPPPPTTTTQAPPGRNGDFLAGFIGVNKETNQAKAAAENQPPAIYMYDFQQATPTPAQNNPDLNNMDTQQLSAMVQKLLGSLAGKQAAAGQG